jgi:hypothetical protein
MKIRALRQEVLLQRKVSQSFGGGGVQVIEGAFTREAALLINRASMTGFQCNGWRLEHRHERSSHESALQSGHAGKRRGGLAVGSAGQSIVPGRAAELGLLLPFETSCSAIRV